MICKTSGNNTTWSNGKWEFIKPTQNSRNIANDNDYNNKMLINND